MPHILTIPRAQAPALPQIGCWPVQDLDFLQAAVWQSRAHAEQDERYLQPIPYLLLRNASGQLWCYQRTGGDARLQGRCSCGVGGHVDRQDLHLQALIYEGQSAVGRVHLGVLYTALWLPDQAPRPEAGEALQGLGFRAAHAIVNDDQFELWSRLAAQHLT